MNRKLLARVLLACAIGGFVLPWLATSNSPAAAPKAAAGWNLILLSLGRVIYADFPSIKDIVPEICIIIIVLAIFLGGILSFGAKESLALRRVACAAFPALISCIVFAFVVNNYSVSEERHVDLGLGYYLTAACLAGVSLICCLAIAAISKGIGGGSNLGSSPDETHRAVSVNDDTAFWDRSTSKTNPDFLEEYLIRFPNGRFSELARKRLQSTKG